MMRVGRTLRILGAVLRAFSFAFLIPLAAALAFEPYSAGAGWLRFPGHALDFLVAGLLTYLASAAALAASRHQDDAPPGEREGTLAAALAWLIGPVFGGLPYVLAGALGPLAAYLEAMAGLTTTAGTSLSASDAPSLLLWRTLTSWIGGAAFLVVAATILGHVASPIKPDPSLQAPKRMRPRLRDTARWVLGTYMLASAAALVAMVAALRHGGFGWGTSLLHGTALAWGAVSTGGTSLHGSDVGGYGDAATLATAAFLILGATSLHVVVALRKGALGRAARDPEWRFFLWLLAASAGLVVLLLALGRWGGASLDGAFAAISIGTTGGYHAGSWEGWPVSAQLVLLALMFVGGCAMSPAGGLKAWRVLLMVRLVARELRRLVHPRAVLPVRMGAHVVRDEAITGTVAFLVTYLLAWLAGAVALGVAEPGVSALGAGGASAAALGNVGTAFGPFGPGAHLEDLSLASQGILALLMWVGRLEILAALLLFVPSTWKA